MRGRHPSSKTRTRFSNSDSGMARNRLGRYIGCYRREAHSASPVDLVAMCAESATPLVSVVGYIAFGGERDS